MFRAIGLVVLAATATIVMSGCAPQTIGTGVILWSPDEAIIRSGSVVTVVSQSGIAGTYRISGEPLPEPIELPRWRVELFTEEQQAHVFAEEYRSQLEGNPSLRARAERPALPIRSEPRTTTGNTIYRLREGEEIKLIGRQPELVNEGGLVSYWYRAMTATGERGWVFGYLLSIFDPTDATVVVQTGPGADPLIDLLLQNVWRPIYFLDMISSRAFDLDLFGPQYGLFPRPEDNQLELILPYHATVFEYQRIARAASRRYVAEGTPLQFNFQRNDELSLQYTLNGRQYILAMQRVSGDIEEYVRAELNRRETAYERLFDRGPLYVSDAYGELSLQPDRFFSWEGYGRLVPAAVPAGAGTTGRVDLGIYLNAELRREFHGALSFRFDGTRDPVSFAYTLLDNGVRLVWIPPEDIRDLVVQRRSVSPLTVFMSAVGG